MVEYTLRDSRHPIGVATYTTTLSEPSMDLKSSLPTIEEIEAELVKKTNKKKDE